MDAVVDVWLAGRTAGQLTPPPRSLTDGSETFATVRACSLGRFGPGRAAVSLPVDTATGKRLALTCRMEAMWRRVVFPAVLVAAAVLVVLFVVDSVRDDGRNASPLLLVALVLAVAVLSGRLVLNRLRSRHHPEEVRGDVYIRGVDRQAAEIWAGLNPPGAVKIIDG
ncbi:hypothetical protein ABZY58_28120 [Micromonospora tulbaghiae]|uniref:hypothetical protein n=1 Tax=Micromonospora tulbaghiae TaxID=479978 RepID=UPI0033B0B4AA